MYCVRQKYILDWSAIQISRKKNVKKSSGNQPEKIGTEEGVDFRWPNFSNIRGL